MPLLSHSLKSSATAASNSAVDDAGARRGGLVAICKDDSINNVSQSRGAAVLAAPVCLNQKMRLEVQHNINITP